MNARSSDRLFVLIALTSLTGTALAGVVKYELDIGKFGKLDNDGNQCGPTATTNAFSFLQNMYPDVYKGDNRIIRDAAGKITEDLAKTRDALAQGWGDKTGGRAGMGVNGTTLKPWWASKVGWLEDFAPGKTRYAAQMYGETDAKNWVMGKSIEAVYPTFSFLWNAINHGAAIELNVIDVPFKQAHAVTLVGLSFDDANKDKAWDKTEKLFMKFVDPNDPTGKEKANTQPVELTVGKDGRFEFKWWQDGGQWYVDSALTETPVPSPATWVLAAGGVMCVARRRRPA
ncbi:MAG TPA: hypothetical protein VK176_05115 [Phycisphaerales bacterium]|nr:hypothetical protein [Phycisphaerales bacterium]